MSHPLVVNVRSGDAYDVYCGRDPRLGDPKWGNQFSHRDGTNASYRVATREEAIKAHRRLFVSQPGWRKIAHELRGKTLACHCAPASCHCDTLAELANLPDIDRILVCGPRDFYNALYVHCVMMGLWREFGDFTLIEGEAPGVDILARKSAQMLGLPIERYPADWSRGRSAGAQRNRTMLQAGQPDLVCAIGIGKGTLNMCAQARTAQVPVIVRAPWWIGRSAR